jgi:peroxiredoxin
MSLEEQLAKVRAASKERVPEDARQVMGKATEDLAKSGILDQIKKAGDKAPDFTLPNAKGQPVSLKSLLAEGALVINFYRGGWCPYCNFELKALQERLPEIRAMGANLIGISPQTPDNSLSTVEKNNLDFDVLSDVGGDVARSFGLVFALPADLKAVYQKLGLDLEKANGDDKWELPMPGTYVIGSDGTIKAAFVDPDYTHRVEPDAVIAALKS